MDVLWQSWVHARKLNLCCCRHKQHQLPVSFTNRRPCCNDYLDRCASGSWAKRQAKRFLRLFFYLRKLKRGSLGSRSPSVMHHATRHLKWQHIFMAVAFACKNTSRYLSDWAAYTIYAPSHSPAIVELKSLLIDAEDVATVPLGCTRAPAQYGIVHGQGEQYLPAPVYASDSLHVEFGTQVHQLETQPASEEQVLACVSSFAPTMDPMEADAAVDGEPSDIQGRNLSAAFDAASEMDGMCAWGPAVEGGGEMGGSCAYQAHGPPPVDEGTEMAGVHAYEPRPVTECAVPDWDVHVCPTCGQAWPPMGPSAGESMPGFAPPEEAEAFAGEPAFIQEARAIADVAEVPKPGAGQKRKENSATTTAKKRPKTEGQAETTTPTPPSKTVHDWSSLPADIRPPPGSKAWQQSSFTIYLEKVRVVANLAKRNFYIYGGQVPNRNIAWGSYENPSVAQASVDNCVF